MNFNLKEDAMNQPMNTNTFLSSLETHAEKPLIFEYAGNRIQPGYHVTEVKRSHIESLDCGANPEGWFETIVQLWDVPGKPDAQPMTAGKFHTIIKKVHARLPLDPDAPLIFECGTPNAPMMLFTAPEPQLENDTVLIRLQPKRASCKPSDRWLQQHDPETHPNQIISLESVSESSACCALETSSNFAANASKSCC
jgi:hypothetical protein